MQLMSEELVKLDQTVRFHPLFSSIFRTFPIYRILSMTFS